LSERELATLERISQDFTQTADLRRNAFVFVELQGHNTTGFILNGNAIQMALDQIIKYRVLEKSILLVENAATDGMFYQFLIENAHYGPRYANVSFDLGHGGGTTLEMEFRRLANEKRVFAAIVDSDRNSPLAENIKLHRLVCIKAQAGWPICFATSPPCREAENVIPMDLAMKLPSGLGNGSNRYLLAIADAEIVAGHVLGHQFWLFFDLKEGLTGERIEQLEGNEKGWIEAKLRLIGLDLDQVSLGGYGDRMFAQLSAENRFWDELRKLTRERRWGDIFDIFLTELIWCFISPVKVRT
jgi:hypothetical protein